MGRKTKPKETEDHATDEEPEHRGPTAELEPDERIAELEAKCADLEAQALRAQADYRNLRRRSLIDGEAESKRLMQPLLEELLLTLDFLDLALASPATNEETRNLALGVQMTHAKFVQALESAQVREVPTRGAFDPTMHDAVDTRVVEGAEPGTIVETRRKGYIWQGSVLRPAQVVVVARPEAEGTPVVEAEQPREEEVP